MLQIGLDHIKALWEYVPSPTLVPGGSFASVLVQNLDGNKLYKVIMGSPNCEYIFV